MGFYESILRPMLFQLDPETAHETAMYFLKRGILKARRLQNPILEQEFFGHKFPNPLGLAAGFDKNALALDHWHTLGFGFVEAGTVTYHPQPGNPKPRMFRMPEDKALINRLGFNNEGARSIASRLAEARPKVPIGVNLGKSKITELGDAPKDYQESYRLLHNFGSYFVINVSSPNTPGLRTLQEKGPLLEILAAMKSVDEGRPIFIKVAPDLETTALDEVVQVAHEGGAVGLIATNTTTSRDSIPQGRQHREEAGGLSGAPLKHLSDGVLSHLYKSCDKNMLLIGVGGIFSGQDLYDKIARGAHLCQVYTGWIYGGPQMIPNVLHEFLGMLQRDGVRSLADLRGSAVA